MLDTIKIVFEIIGGTASIMCIALLVLLLLIAAIIDLGGNVDIKFFTRLVKVIGILFAISAVTCIIAILL